ncbi:SUF system NifU family Fe-S cluster assembly protein [Alteribacter lacisalsi]|uniref:SUF system NifU family Fe-S cluster assembly protein n=1 Tax=Alteribacter lacisalsi TaxID=2045244 RepID=A0A2W0H6R4_9BACI|nr:SUF system NifU family Fe-S cluster assembly protein [Alteribacter lacisalsi]PYZ97544.1 SUF system NifU family Fe-S cluster assembly protein [Alteribacter lacisalsi]
MLNDLYRQLIIDHAKRKRNHPKMEEGTSLHYKNPTCGDVMTLYWRWDNDGTLADVSFIGEGCSISMASCSMMSEIIRRKTPADIHVLRQAMEELIREGRDPESTDLGDALSLAGVHRLRARHNCALMPWQAIDRAFLNDQFKS